MKKIVALIALLVLAGCEDPEVQRRRILEALPDGCTMTDLGSYRYIDNLVMIQCDGRITTTTTGTYRSGKTTAMYTTVDIGGA